MPHGLWRGLACCCLAFGAAAEAAAQPSPALQEAAAQAEAEQAVQGIADMDCWEKHITYEPLDMRTENNLINMTREPTPLACQQRCERIPGCMHFAYWVPQGDCHLQDIFAIRQTNRLGFVSGPKRCYRDDDDALSYGMARLRSKGVGKYTFVPVEFSCLEVSTMYNSFRTVQSTSFNVTPAHQDPLEAMGRCQQLCRVTEGCAHFTMGAPGLGCALAGAESPAVFPIFRHVSGPPDNCTEKLYERIGRPTQTTTTAAALGVSDPDYRGDPEAIGSGAPMWLWPAVVMLGLCCLTAVIAAAGMMSGKKKKKKKTRNIQIEDDSGSDDATMYKEPAPAKLTAPAAPMLMVPTAMAQWWPWQAPLRQFRYQPVPSMSAFDAIDRNHDGVIDRDEYNQAMARQPRATTYAIPRATTYATPPMARSFCVSPRGPQAPPMASVQVTGPDLNRDGIPDALQQASGPLAQALSVQALPRQPPPQPARLPSAPHMPHAPQAPLRLLSGNARPQPPPHGAWQALPRGGARR